MVHTECLKDFCAVSAVHNYVSVRAPMFDIIRCHLGVWDQSINKRVGTSPRMITAASVHLDLPE